MTALETSAATQRTSPANDPTANLWACLDPTADPLRAAHALTGIDPAALLQLTAAETVTTPALRQRLEDGPLDTKLFSMIAAVEPMLAALPVWAYDDELLRDARQQVTRANAALSLAEDNLAQANGVTIEGANIRLTPSLGSVLALIDKRSRQQHAVFLAVIGLAVEAGIGNGVPALTVSTQGSLSCPSLGPVSYMHPGARGSDARTAGIRLGHTVVDVPDYQHQKRGDAWASLRSRSGTSRTIVIFDPAEIISYRDEIVAELRQSASSS